MSSVRVCVRVCGCVVVELHVTISCTEILIVAQQCVYINVCRRKPSGTTTGVFVQILTTFVVSAQISFKSLQYIILRKFAQWGQVDT